MSQQPTLIKAENTKEKFCFWQINGSIDLAIIPANTIKGIPHTLPIRLQQGFAKGKQGFGYLHILNNHGQEFSKLRPPQDVFEFLTRKLGQGGSFHFQTDQRKGLFLSMQPSGAIFLDYIQKGKDSYFSIITAYTCNSVDGQYVGRYISTFQVRPDLVNNR
jgi:hypothetical protein